MTVRMTGITGLLDTDALVSASMQPYKAKYTTQQQKEELLEWKQEAYRDVMKDANALYTKYLTSDGSSSLLMSSTYNASKFTSTQDGTVSVTGAAGAAIENYSVDVAQLAAKASTTLKATDISSSATLDFTLGGKSIDTINTSGKSQSQIVSDLNAALKAKGISATAKTSDFSGGIVIESSDMGSDVSFTATLKDSGGTELNIATKTATGKNLYATIKKADGTTYTISDSPHKSNSNNVTLDGVTFNFKDTTGASATPDASGNFTGGTSVKITGSKDVSAVKDKIKSFITDYNALLGKINTKLYEKYDKAYQPLTDDQKKDMSETQITKWETKAKTGLLHNDSYLDELAQSMKTSLLGIAGDKMVSSSGLTLEKIGIKPVEDYSSQNGLYEVDDATLTSALENNIDAVQELFSKNTGDVSTSGLGKQLGDVIWNQVKKTDSTFNNLAGTENGSNALTNDMSKQITDMKKKIAEMKNALDDRENTLYTKYAKMESALSKLQSQQSSLSSYFSSGSQG
ncbi:flagellar filament capping protein FliD [Clostridium saccharoperbutylacetonicum]|uniref:flagellar filament capping protein FliD n=1 Tax=Clostridium saccharoperbutylacetonicum TaxID=36745 RepID=UPI0039E87D4E